MAYTDKSKLRVVYGDYTLGVHGKEFNYIFSYAQGGLESIVKNGYEWLYRCPKPTFWRALTDNDRGSKFHIKSGSWLSADMFIDCKDVQVFMDGEVQKIYAPDNNSYEGDVSADEIMVQYTYETINTPSTTVVVTYTVDITGKIQVNVHYNGVKGLPEFPVFGMRFVMPTLADKYLYKGLSGETYPDRKAGAIDFHYTRHEDNKTVTETIPALNFIQKLIVHISEKHFKMLRYYGIYAKHHKQEMKLRKCISAEKQCFLHSS